MTYPGSASPGSVGTEGQSAVYRPARPSRGDETKAAFKTTEFVAYLVTLAAIAITCIALDGGDGEPDPFVARDALQYIAWVTIGYMVARGLAKAGRHHYDDGDGYDSASR